MKPKGKSKNQKLTHRVNHRKGGRMQLTPVEIKEIEKRNSIIEQYLPYAASIASKIMQSLSSGVDYDDVMCNARLGLLEAARKFDTGMNVDFKTFAYYSGIFASNYHAPNGTSLNSPSPGWKTALKYALKHSEGYVWNYAQHADWWTPSFLPDEYLNATRDARTEMGMPP